LKSSNEILAFDVSGEALKSHRHEKEREKLHLGAAALSVCRADCGLVLASYINSDLWTDEVLNEAPEIFGASLRLNGHDEVIDWCFAIIHGGCFNLPRTSTVVVTAHIALALITAPALRPR
jgi:hypothetical protein